MEHRPAGLKLIATVLATAAMFGPSALAAEPAPAPNAAAAAFGDWVLHCQSRSEGAKSVRFCEVAQSIQVQGQQGPFARIAIGRTVAGQPLAATIVLPSDISLPSVVHIGPDGDAELDLNWTRCTSGGCFAQSPLTDKILDQWRTNGRAGKISFEDAAGQDVSFPMSFKGLTQALGALAKEH